MGLYHCRNSTALCFGCKKTGREKLQIPLAFRKLKQLQFEREFHEMLRGRQVVSSLSQQDSSRHESRQQQVRPQHLLQRYRFVLEMEGHRYQMADDTLPLRHAEQRFMCNYEEPKDTRRKRMMYTKLQYSESFCWIYSDYVPTTTTYLNPIIFCTSCD